MRARVPLAVLVAAMAAAQAHASTIEALSPERLYAESDRVVDATVIDVSTAWNRAHDGLETTVVLAVDSTEPCDGEAGASVSMTGRSGVCAGVRGDAAPTATFVVPGGTLDGATQIIVGMPAVGLGERARWFLRDRGDGVLAVYGWAQGKWPARTVGGKTVYAPDPLAAERRGGVLEFTTNGMVWPAGVMPVPYLIQSAGSDDLALPDIIGAIDAAFATWQDVSCASLTFTNAGMTDLGMAVDGTNVLMFIESGWIYGPEAAAATSLFIIDGQQTADVAMNGERFTWVIGPPGSGVNTDTLDLQGVLTHELGHFSGLGHAERAFDTMYYSWKPWPGQRTLSVDDKLGLCSIYPVTADECPATACAADETCTTHPLGTLCEGTPDPIGAPCNYDRVECDAFCLFTAVNLSSGYCSKFCETNADCPLTHHCDNASAGQMTVRVCFAGAQPPPDAGMPPVTCTSDDDCSTGEHCDTATGGCTFDCRVAADCGGGQSCDDRGFCVDGSGGGCGCQTADPGFLAPILAVLCALTVVRRRRRR